jgi:hypothetical protein
MDSSTQIKAMDQFRWESDFAHIFVICKQKMPGRGSNPKEYLRGFFGLLHRGTIKKIKLFFQAFPTFLKVLF